MELYTYKDEQWVGRGAVYKETKNEFEIFEVEKMKGFSIFAIGEKLTAPPSGPSQAETPVNIYLPEEDTGFWWIIILIVPAVIAAVIWYLWRRR